MTEETQSAETPRVVAANLKLPLFWPSDPEVWFAQVEAQFTTRGIMQQRTKFDYVVASLSPDFVTEVRDLILHPPDAQPYDTLHEQLVQRTAASAQRHLQQLTTEEFGDRKPSQLLHRMQQLLGDRAAVTDSAFVRELFLQRLPASVRVVLASATDNTSLEDISQLANRIMEALPSPLVAITLTNGPPSEVEQLRAEVSRLADLVASISPRDRDSSQQPRRHQSPTPHHSPSPSASQHLLCWYH